MENGLADEVLAQRASEDGSGLHSVETLPMVDLGRLSRDAVAWVSPSVRTRLAQYLTCPVLPTGEFASGCSTLVVAGGGQRIDFAKIWRAEHEDVRLVVVPTLWGSGADASPIAVQNLNSGGKRIFMGPQYLPNVRVIVPDLAANLPESLARAGAGDTWAHALEGFTSPLANETLRRNLARLMNRMLERGIRRHPDWFDFSAEACAGQAQSSVGLVHGIAHVLEPSSAWGHAELCRRLLWPVFRYNSSQSSKFQANLREYGIDPGDVEEVLRALYEPADYEVLIPSMVERWRSILRDPSTRTNCTPVRPGSLEFFRHEVVVSE